MGWAQRLSFTMSKAFRRIHDLFQVEQERLDELGVYDGFVNIDSALYIDPFLLEKSSARELSKAKARFDRYFNDQYLRVSRIKKERDLFWNEAYRHFLFPEIKELSLGHGKHSNYGRGVGPKLARSLLETSCSLIQNGLEDARVFRLVGLFQDDMGFDLIGDMTAQIILDDLCAYSSRIALALGASTKLVKIRGSEYQLPYDHGTKKGVILIPRDVLSSIPIALEWDDIDDVVHQNKTYREQLNQEVGSLFKKCTIKEKKDRFRRLVVENPEIAKTLLKMTDEVLHSPYDFGEDPDGTEREFLKVAEHFSLDHPFAFRRQEVKTAEDLVRFVADLLKHVRRLVEENGLNRALYHPDRPNVRRKEKFLQALMHALFVFPSEQYNIKVNPEADHGRGPVDFEFSLGADKAVNVELKFSDHKKLFHGWETQLKIYNTSGNVRAGYYVVFQVTEAESRQLKKIKKEAAKVDADKRLHLLVIDAVVHPSASKDRSS